jgi:hypothetical protein
MAKHKKVVWGVVSYMRPQLESCLSLDATEREIRVSFRELSRVYHPDRHKLEQTGLTQREATEKFQLINNAYSKACKTPFAPYSILCRKPATPHHPNLIIHIPHDHPLQPQLPQLSSINNKIPRIIFGICVSIHPRTVLSNVVEHQQTLSMINTITSAVVHCLKPETPLLLKVPITAFMLSTFLQQQVGCDTH